MVYMIYTARVAKFMYQRSKFVPEPSVFLVTTLESYRKKKRHTYEISVVERFLQLSFD